MTLSQLTCGPQQRSASRADMANCCLQLATVEAVVSFYALIHVPLADQRALFPRIRAWLRLGGYFLAIVGAQRWTGIGPTSAPTCSGSMPAPPATCAGPRAAQLRPPGIAMSPKATAGTASYSPRRHNAEQGHSVSGTSGCFPAL